MKNTIFNKMREYGWNLGDNTYKSFADVYDVHYGFINSIYDYFRKQEENGKSVNLNDIPENDLFATILFMKDFLRALNELDSETKTSTQEDRMLGTLADLLNKE